MGSVKFRATNHTLLIGESERWRAGQGVAGLVGFGCLMISPISCEWHLSVAGGGE